MAFERARWPAGLALRLGLLVAATTLLGLLLTRTEFYATALLAACVIALLFGELLRYTGAADRELARVIEALGQGDFADRPLRLSALGTEPLLARAFAQALDKLRERAQGVAARQARLTAIIEHAPVPLLAIEDGGQLLLLNRAARRLFAGAAPATRADLFVLAPELGDATLRPGARRVVRLALPRGPQRCLVSVAGSSGAGRNTIFLALQNIQGELEASEIRAWEELVRVLAHEIMNSLTPVASLAESAGLLIGDLRPALDPSAHPLLEELGDAVDAIHRRSAGLMRFVESYRRFAEPPLPIKRPVRLDQLFERARRLVSAALAEARIRLDIAVEPPGLVVEADPDLVDQALLNLLKNAIEAAEGSAQSLVSLSAGLDIQGRLVVTVADSGPGLPPELARQIFVPFFTTKPKGSGIGLPIVRQIMLAHGGTVEAVPGGENGAEFRLVFG
jgi:nitrogen fixation/metabolism regulation signal transduction histidine kinase